MENMKAEQAECCEQWQQRITEQEATGQAIRAYCGERGLKQSTSYAWRQRLRAEGVCDIRVRLSTASFVEALIRA